MLGESADFLLYWCKCSAALRSMTLEEVKADRDDNYMCDSCNKTMKVFRAAAAGALVCSSSKCDWGLCGKCAQSVHDAALAAAQQCNVEQRSPPPRPPRPAKRARAARVTPAEEVERALAPDRTDCGMRFEATGKMRVVLPLSAAVNYARIAGAGQTITTAATILQLVGATSEKSIRRAFFAALAEVEQHEALSDLYVGKSKVRNDRVLRADASPRQLRGRPPVPAAHGPFALGDVLSWAHESFARIAGHAGFWNLCAVVAVANEEKLALAAEDMMIEAARESNGAAKVVNPRCYSPGRKSSSDGPGFFCYVLCRFASH